MEGKEGAMGEALADLCLRIPRCCMSERRFGLVLFATRTHTVHPA